MNTLSNKNRLPFRFILSGIAAAILLVSTVLVGLYLGVQTQKRFHNIDASWQTYANHAAVREELLSRIRAHLGYGGIIHNFKNYVLRKDDRYLNKLRSQLITFHKTISEYKQTSASSFELSQLRLIEHTISQYEKKIPITIQAARENWPPTKTDRFVKVDDSLAIKAITSLDVYLKEKEREATRSISAAVKEGNELVKIGFFFAGVLAVVALILYVMFFQLLKELRQSISKLSDELEERRAAELLAKKFQRAVEQSPATILITNTKREIEYVNRKFCELTGYEPKEVLGKTPKLLQSGDLSPVVYDEMISKLENNQQWHGTFRNLKKDGSCYWAETVILPLRDDNGKITHYIGLGEDITEHKKAREHILRAQKMEAVGLLASGVAHDFNNVLTTILGNVHLASLDAPKEGEFSQELEQIEIAAKRARHLVGQILAFARRQPGKAVLVNVGELIEEVLRLIRASTQPNIKLKSEIESDDLAVLADPTRLHQVLMNLCSNAAEAISGNDAAKGGVITIKAYRQNDAQTGDSNIILEVNDDGPGIPEHIQEEIFTPFFTTKRAGKGTGLGLSVVASLVDDMNGELSIDSQLGHGCQFMIKLSQASAIEESKAIRNERHDIGARILLIDDEPEVVATSAAILRRMSYKVDEYTDPHQGLAAYKKAPDHYDLVITDFIMPDLSGQDVCAEIRKISKDCPIIIYSAYQPEKLEFVPFEPIRLIGKPFDPERLANTINTMLSE